MMTDMFGLPLQIGDEVIYTTGGQGNTLLERGFILEFVTQYRKPAAYIKTATGRRSTNPRHSHELASITPHRINHPELFI